MKKVTMFFAVALICTVFSFAAEESAPQAELQMQAPVLSEQTEAAEIAVSETLEQADAPAAPSELPVDDAMLVTPEIPAEDTAAAPEEQLPAEEEADVPEEQLPTEEEADAPEEQLPTEEEADVPEEQLPAEEEAAEPEEQLPAEEELPLVEIPETEIPVAAAPVSVTVRGVVYDGDTVVYVEEQTIEAADGDELDLNAYVWTETPGITLSCDAGTVCVSTETTEYVLTYELQDGWVIL